MANSDLVKSCTWAALKMHILRRQTCEFGPENCWKMCISPWCVLGPLPTSCKWFEGNQISELGLMLHQPSQKGPTLKRR